VFFQLLSVKPVRGVYGRAADEKSCRIAYRTSRRYYRTQA
jgi:hypothetical protein